MGGDAIQRAPQPVREIVRQAGLAMRQPELPDAIRRNAAQLYAAGLTLAQVSTQLGVSDEAVRSAVTACGGAPSAPAVAAAASSRSATMTIDRCAAGENETTTNPGFRGGAALLRA